MLQSPIYKTMKKLGILVMQLPINEKLGILGVLLPIKRKVSWAHLFDLLCGGFGLGSG